MRIELILENPRPDTGVAVSMAYNHALASFIYQILAVSSADYSAELHDKGVPFEGKRFKLFTFSQLLSDRRRVVGDQLILLSPVIRWLVSSPMDEFVIHFASGILERGVVRVHEVEFRIRELRTLPPPTFRSKMRFTCLSPITVSRHINAPGLNPLQYGRLEDRFYEKVVENLRRKHELLNGFLARHTRRAEGEGERHASNGLALKMEFDPNYIARKKGRIHKLIRYKDTDIFCYLAPFKVEGDAALIRNGYECGFGDGNSKGFGMVEVDDASERNH